MKRYIVWNASRTEGFVTSDKQLAYEARKGSDTNCYSQDGKLSKLAVVFVDETEDEDCTIQEITID